MIRSRAASALSAAACLAVSATLAADVRTEQRTQVRFEGTLGRIVNMFGGKAAREGIRSTVAVQGDRKATLSDQTGQIVDLNEEKIYDLDLRRKSYKVTTFADLRRRMEEAMKKAEAGAAQDPQPATKPDQPAQELDIDFEVKDTGQNKAINGFDTRQVVMTVTMREKGKTIEQSGGLVLTTDLWLTP
jgi:hypothetical protein